LGSAGTGCPESSAFIVAYGAPDAGRQIERAPWKRALLFFFQLLRQVVLVAHLADGVELCLEPVNMMLFVGKNLLRQFARSAVIHSQA